MYARLFLNSNIIYMNALYEYSYYVNNKLGILTNYIDNKH